MRGRRGFTMVELSVAVSIAVIVIVLAWQIYRNERLRFAVDQDRLTGLEGALVLDQSLAQDLDRILLDLPQAAAFTVSDPVQIPDARTLQFRVADDQPSQRTPTPILVTYRLDATRGRVVRSYGGKETTFRNLLAEDVQFSKVSVRLQWPPTDQPAFNAAAPLLYIKYALTCFSERMAELPPEQRPPQGRVVFVGAAALRMRSDRAFQPYWRPVHSELIEGP